MADCRRRILPVQVPGNLESDDEIETTVPGVTSSVNTVPTSEVQSQGATPSSVTADNPRRLPTSPPPPALPPVTTNIPRCSASPPALPPAETNNLGRSSAPAPPPVHPPASRHPSLPSPSSLVCMPPDSGLDDRAATPIPQSNLPAESPQARRWRRANDTPEPDAESNADTILTPAINNEIPQTLRSIPSGPSPPPTSTPVSTTSSGSRNIAVTTASLDSSTCPTHMVDAYCYFTEEPGIKNSVSAARARDWGDGWMECLREFIEFQKRAGFPDVGLSFPSAAGFRPPEISVWMKNRRPWKDMEVADKETFGQQWWSWWSSLQPDSRTPSDEPTIHMDWGKLQKAGRNGFLLIMLSLTWWGKASERDGQWLEAVAEVSMVLRCMGASSAVPSTVHGPLIGSNAANIAASSKRRSEDKDKEEGPSKRTRRR